MIFGFQILDLKDHFSASLRLNCKKIFTFEISEIISFSDANDTGCGSMLSVRNQICHITWNTVEKTKSFIWRELTAVKFGILSFLPLIPRSIPRCQNKLADFISKIVDYDDWYVSVELFQYLEQLWGPHSIDHFAAVSETEKRPDTILGEDKSQRNKHPHREW